VSSPDDASPATRVLNPQCLSIDLEVGRNSGVIHQLAALRGDTAASRVFPPGTLSEALDVVDQLADSAAFLLGHNLIAFDLPHLRAARPNLRLLAKPVVDTLRLNPLAFPKNPYHHLVKHYKDNNDNNLNNNNNNNRRHQSINPYHKSTHLLYMLLQTRSTPIYNNNNNNLNNLNNQSIPTLTLYHQRSTCHNNNRPNNKRNS
jgi:hypothetical protein